MERINYLDRIIDWARGEEGIRLVLLVGSGARLDHPADEWSDIDLVLAATDPRRWLTSTGWLVQFGEVWFSYPERHFENAELTERRVLFAGGQDVDFIIPSMESARQGFAGTFIPEIASRGMRILLDKDGIQPGFPVQAASKAVQPLEETFLDVVSDFWFNTAWAAKKLRRGELWVAIRCCDDYLKWLLLRLLEWQAVGAVWYNARFLEEWVAPEVQEGLRSTFAHYDPQDAWRALRANMELFDRLARQVAERWGYDYPAVNVEKVRRWVEACYAAST